ncbi:unnamed protein product [Linum trigynum]|uniref:CCHC-type domain-containing protein n=1 Tax=Linum trigynum TaxID=586398 RepID=A0AAV2FVE3_9ROSI
MKEDDEDEWSDEQKKSAQLDSRAMHILLSAISEDEGERINKCESAKEIWSILETTHEGTSEVKETRIDLLLKEYETFDMISGESISDMDKRFSTLVNILKGLGKSFTSKELVRKVLRSLPLEWMAKRTTIEEAKDLNVLSLENLIGSLLSHEEVLKHMNTLHDKKNKTIAFQSVCSIEEEKLDEDFENELALTSKKLQRMIKYKHDLNAKRGGNAYPSRASGNSAHHTSKIPGHHTIGTKDKNSFASNRTDFGPRDTKTSNDKSDSTICFKCGKTGHIRANCPLNKRREQAMTASWSDYSSEEESEVVAYMGLNSCSGEEPISEKVWSDSYSDSVSETCNEDFFLHALSNLQNECNLLKSKFCLTITQLHEKETGIIRLQKLVESQQVAQFTQDTQVTNLIAENKELKKKIYQKQKLLNQNFWKHNPDLKTHHLDDSYRYMNPQKHSEPQRYPLFCSNCNLPGHNQSYCFYKKSKPKLVWVVKTSN